MAVKQALHLGTEYISELGHATLGSAAVLLGIDPEVRPRPATAGHARRWLAEHFVRDGQVSIPTSA